MRVARVRIADRHQIALRIGNPLLVAQGLWIVLMQPRDNAQRLRELLLRLFVLSELGIGKERYPQRADFKAEPTRLEALFKDLQNSAAEGKTALETGQNKARGS